MSRVLITATKKLHDLTLLLEETDRLIDMMNKYRMDHREGRILPLLEMSTTLQDAAVAEMKLITE